MPGVFPKSDKFYCNYEDMMTAKYKIDEEQMELHLCYRKTF